MSEERKDDLEAARFGWDIEDLKDIGIVKNGKDADEDEEEEKDEEEEEPEEGGKGWKGGPGSGNFGHAGRPGEVGGSAEGEGGIGDVHSLNDQQLIDEARRVPLAERPNSPLWREIERRGGPRAVQDRINAAKPPEPKPPATSVDIYTQSLGDPKAAARAKQTLERQRIINGKPDTQADYIAREVANGARTQVDRNGRRIFMKPNGAFMYESDLSKTALDYADFLIAQQAKTD